MSTAKSIDLTEDDLKEIFSLFTSVTRYERDQIYDQSSGHYYLDIDPLKEYTVSQDQREFALDAWRAVLYFLRSKGWSLCKDGERSDLSFIEEHFIP